MTEKEFSKLTRQELLKLLLTQGREQKQLEEQMSEMTRQFHELEQGYERLKKRLNDKDVQIERLKERLNDKDVKIRDLKITIERERVLKKIRIQESGSIAEAALKLNNVFETAQKAADQYLENIAQRAHSFETGVPWYETEDEKNEVGKSETESALHEIEDDESEKKKIEGTKPQPVWREPERTREERNDWGWDWDWDFETETIRRRTENKKKEEKKKFDTSDRKLFGTRCGARERRGDG